MYTTYSVKLSPVSITSGEAESRLVKSKHEYSDAVSLTIESPATLDSLTFTLEIPNDVDNPTSWTVHQVGISPADETVPAAGKARTYYDLVGTKGFRIKASGNVAATRTFLVTKNARV